MDYCTEKPIYSVNIDFDYASYAWRKNKKQVGNCHFLYICGATCKTGKLCKNTVDPHTLCHVHKKK